MDVATFMIASNFMNSLRDLIKNRDKIEWITIKEEKK